jgi:hypothetical protein
MVWTGKKFRVLVRSAGPVACPIKTTKEEVVQHLPTRSTTCSTSGGAAVPGHAAHPELGPEAQVSQCCNGAGVLGQETVQMEE